MLISTFREREFLSYLTVSGNASAAARAVGVTLSTVTKRYKENKEFAQAWDDAMALAGGALEEAVYRRAVNGVAKKLWYRGEPVIDPETGEQAVEVSHDTSREALLLKRFMPEQYRERSDVRVSQVTEFDEMSDAELLAAVDRIREDMKLRAEDVEFRELTGEEESRGGDADGA